MQRPRPTIVNIVRDVIHLIKVAFRLTVARLCLVVNIGSKVISFEFSNGRLRYQSGLTTSNVLPQVMVMILPKPLPGGRPRAQPGGHVGHILWSVH